MAYLPYLALGLISMLAQITSIRELLSVFSGNELDIGITLGVWLLSISLGSLAGSRLKQGSRALAWSFLGLSMLLPLGLLEARLIHTALGLEPGETVSLGATMLSTMAILLPQCFVLGLQYPIATRMMEASGAPGPARRVYLLEAAGALAGGLVHTFVLAGRWDAIATVAVLSGLAVLMASHLLRSKTALLLLALPLLVTPALQYAEGMLWRSGVVVSAVESRYGRIVISRLGSETNVYASGHLSYTYPDRLKDETAVHLPLLTARNIESVDSVLLIGGSPGMLRELLRYPIKRIDYVEPDPRMIEVALGMLGQTDPRLRPINRDARRFIKGLATPTYSFVILGLSEPSTASLNRYFTREFYAELRSVLLPEGVLAARLPSSSGYMSVRKRMVGSAIYQSLASVFPHVATSTEEYGIVLAASGPLDVTPEALRARYAASPVSRAEGLKFHPYIIDDAFDPVRAGLMQGRMSTAGELNTDMKPVAYLYNLMLWTEAHGGRVAGAVLRQGKYAAYALIVLFALYAAFVFGNSPRTLGYCLFTTGYASMAMSVTLVLGFQSLYGYVYERFGLLSALFMAGAASGSAGVSYISTRLKLTRINMLLIIEALLCMLCILYPRLFVSEPAFYALSFVSGALGGAGFALASGMHQPGQAVHHGGTLYALDMAGSFVGAITVSILLVPVLGFERALLIAASSKALSGVLLLRSRNA